MTQTRKTSILHKLLTLMLPLVLAATVLTAAVISWTNYAYFRKTIRQDYSHIVSTSASEIKLYMENARKDMESLAWLLRFSPTDSRQAEIAITAFTFSKPKFDALYLIGINKAASVTEVIENLEKSAEEARIIQKAFAGEFAISKVVFNESRLPMIYMAAPVQHLGKIDAVLFGTLNLKWVWDVLDGLKIGRTGQVAILDQSGRPVGHSEMDRVVKADYIADAAMLKKIKAAPEPVEWIEYHDGQRHFSIAAYIPEHDWIIVLCQDTSELFAYLHSNILWAVLLSVLICAVAAVMGWYLVRHFTRPIQALHQQVQRIGAGDLDHKATVATFDEIGELAGAFNEMTSNLKEKIAQEIQSAQELAHAQDLAVLGASAGKVTHEVGNLLNNVGMVANALGDETLSPRGTTALAKMEKESARVSTFIQDFLKFAKPPELRLAQLPLDLIVREVVAMHTEAAKAKNIRFDVDWPPQTPEILADAQLIYQVFNNLIKNSTEAIEGQGRIGIRATVDGAWLAITVKDSGPGIAPEHLERIFEPFFTTKGKLGTGLGMAIVQSIITAHRGTITCQSNPGQGTRFIIRLPLK